MIFIKQFCTALIVIILNLPGLYSHPIIAEGGLTRLSHQAYENARPDAGHYCGEHVHCPDGSTCYGVGPKAKCYTIVGYAGICSAPYTSCGPNLTCRRPGNGIGPKKCVPARSIGAGCDNGYHSCEKGLECNMYFKSRRCMLISGENGDCSKSFMFCKEGLHCERSGGYARCRRARANKGQLCSSLIQCSPGLTCYRSGTEARCYSEMGYGGVCDGKFMLCAGDLSCRAPAYGKGPRKCVSPRVRGQGCDGGWHFCGKGLTCSPFGNHKRCLGIMNEGQVCSKPFMFCRQGLECTEVSGGYHLCQKPRAAKGQHCGPSALCASGLECIEGKCFSLAGYNAVCSGTFVKCTDGLSCRAPAYGNNPSRCVPPRTKGASCDKGYHFCKPGLTCQQYDHITRCVELSSPYGKCGERFTLCKKDTLCTSHSQSGKRFCIPNNTAGAY